MSISYEEFLFEPENYQPLTSVKGVKAAPSRLQFDDQDVKELFLAVKNIAYLGNNLYAIHTQLGGRSDKSKYRELVVKLVPYFLKLTDFSQYVTVEYQATGNNNTSEALLAANNDFMKFCLSKLQANHFNPYREVARVGPSDDKKNVKYYEMTADDIKTVDTWHNYSTQLNNNRHYSNGNKPYIWEASIHSHNFDRANEGLQAKNSDRASLANPVRGFDMSKIHTAVTQYSKEDYYSY